MSPKPLPQTPECSKRLGLDARIALGIISLMPRAFFCWLHDPRFSNFDQRLHNKAALIPILEKIFAEKTNAEWLPILAAKVPCAPVRGIAEARDDPLLAAHNMIVEYEHPVFGKVREAGCPIKVSGSASQNRPAPSLGQDTEEILSGYLGFSPRQIVELRSRGVV